MVAMVVSICKIFLCLSIVSDGLWPTPGPTLGSRPSPILISRETLSVRCRARREHLYLTEGVYTGIFQGSVPAQIRQLIICYY